MSASAVQAAMGARSGGYMSSGAAGAERMVEQNLHGLLFEA